MDKKIRVNISLDLETDEMIRRFAKKGHTTVSQWITDRVWEKVEEEARKEKILKELG